VPTVKEESSYKELHKVRPFFSYMNSGNPMTITFSNNKRDGKELSIKIFKRGTKYGDTFTYRYDISKLPFAHILDSNLRAFNKIHKYLMKKKLQQELDGRAQHVDEMITKSFPHIVDDILLED
jgi:hypothetical protein